MKRGVWLVVTAGALLACDDDAVAPTGRADVAVNPDSARVPAAAEIAVEPEIPALGAADVQAALEKLASGLVALTARVAALEEAPSPVTPEPPVARDVAFDSAKTHVQATNVQTLGEALDLTTQLLTTDVEDAANAAALAGSAAALAGDTAALAASRANDLETSLATLGEGVSALEAAVTKELAAHAFEIEGLNYVVGLIYFADGIALEHWDTLIEDYIFHPSVIPGPETVYSAIKYLAQRVSVHDALFASPCPPEMFNESGAHCVDKERHTSEDTWAWRAQYCKGQGKRLCRPSELFVACYEAGIASSDKAPDGGFDVEEFMDQLGSDGKALTLTGKNCDVVKGYSIHSGMAYARCCKDINPTAAK